MRLYCIDYFGNIACLICLLEAWKMQENELRFLRFLENAMNLLSEHAALSEFIDIHWMHAFLEELAKRAYRAKRVHLLRMKTHPLAKMPMAKRGWIAKPR